MRSRSTSRISAFGRRLTKTTKRKPWRASYSAFRRASSASTAGIVVRALLGRRARGEPVLLADRRVRVEHLALLGVGQLVDHGGRVPERVVALGEQLDEPRPALEELGELLDAQLPR